MKTLSNRTLNERDEGTPHTFSVVEGEAEREILSRMDGYDLLVMGVSAPLFRRIGMASVSENVARRAPRKVETMVKRFV